jgi:peptidoglycan/xylan/chitin deacetylase (PgdA/CDA1 family)
MTIAKDPGYKEINLPILMYHHINTFRHGINPLGLGLSITPKKFEQQVAFLASESYETISLGDLARAMRNEYTLPLKPIVLSFDDCYADNYRFAYKILKKYQMTGTFFLISDMIGQKGHMTADQVVEMSEAGMDMQSHTKTHAMLTIVGNDRQKQELALSKTRIEHLTGKPVCAVAYPFGRYKMVTTTIAAEEGYELGLSTVYGKFHSIGKPFELTRIRIVMTTRLSTFARLIAPETVASFGKNRQWMSLLLQKLPF